MNALAPPVVRRATLIALAGALALYVAITLTGVGGARLDAFASTWMYSGLLVAGALEGALPAVLTNLAYPVGDLLLFGLVVLLSALRGWRADRAWLLLGGGLALSAVADSWYLAEIA